MRLPLVSPRIEALQPYKTGKPHEELVRTFGDRLVLAGSNENDGGCSPLVPPAVAEAAMNLHLYPDGAAMDLRRSLANNLNVDPAQITIGNGSDELIGLAIQTFTVAGDEVIVPETSFIRAKLATEGHDGRVFISTPVDADYKIDVQAIIDAVGPSTKLAYIAVPNNPTGTDLKKDAFEYLVKTLPEDVVLVVDEAYFEHAVAEEDHPNTLDYFTTRERLMALRTFSKIYGLAGARMGYAVAPPEMIDRIDAVRPAFNTNTLGQIAAITALQDTEHISRSRQLVIAERPRLTKELEALGLRVTPSAGNFVLVDFGRPAGPIFELMAKAGVIARPVGVYGLLDHLRITVCREEKNIQIVDAVADALKVVRHQRGF